MRTYVPAIALALAAIAPAYAASTPAQILDANRVASGGSAWDGKAAIRIDLNYSGQGMTGTVESLDDLRNGHFADNATIGPASVANGYDGTAGWEKDPNGTVTSQTGGETQPLNVNESYRRSNAWWQPDRGGAQIAGTATKTDGGNSYDVLTITPKGGRAFDAWFDAKTHLLYRTVEQQGSRTITSTFADYRPVDGVQIAFRQTTNEGDAKYDQTTTVTKVAFLPPPDASAFAAPANKVADYAIAGGTETSFPFHLYNNHIYAGVMVNGKGPFQFIFDTGGVNMLTPPTVTTLGLKTEGQMQGNGAGSGHMDVSLTKVQSIQLGNATIKDQIFAVIGLDQMRSVEGVAMPGMVGFETFRRFVTRVDYGTRTMTLIDPKAFNPKDAGEPVPFKFDGNTIEADASYNGVTGAFTIDTGSRSSVTLNAPFAAKNNIGNSRSVDAITGWGVGGPTRSVAMRGNTLKIGSLSVTSPVTEVSTDKGGAFAEDAIAGNIGAGILKRWIVTLDYEHQIMYLKPATAQVADLDTFDRSGMWINEDGANGFKVIDVTKGAPAEAAGLKAGDIITAVDGKPANGLHLYEVRAQLRDAAPGTTVTFTVKGDNGTRDVKVTLRDLI